MLYVTDEILEQIAELQVTNGFYYTTATYYIIVNNAL